MLSRRLVRASAAAQWDRMGSAVLGAGIAGLAAQRPFVAFSAAFS
jgi:hypothetical protein